jgi:UDP-glucose 4-epimerase
MSLTCGYIDLNIFDPKDKYILITGGLGYIGSHIVLELVQCGYKVVIFDNLSNSKIEVLHTLREMTRDFPDAIACITEDLCNNTAISGLFCSYRIGWVIHMAGLKSVTESLSDPLKYYQNNLIGTLNLLDAMKRNGCKRLVFSSSATVYGNQTFPVTEESSTGIGITNPYGQTKYQIETILQDLAKSDPSWTIVMLRYFNPIGNHPSGLLGEDPQGIPNNLFPYIVRVASKQYPLLQIYGCNYPTPDGTCIRDFIHVVDLAKGHLAAIQRSDIRGCHVYNLGTGTGTSVTRLLETFCSTNRVTFPYQVVTRRDGDLAEVYANVDKAKHELRWVAERTTEDACRDGWKFATLEASKSNPQHD